jgi:iron complex transport system substrate-binding protein
MRVPVGCVVRVILILAATLAGCDSGVSPVQSDEPAQRIITLSPHLTELVFTAGAGDQLVGVVAYSDYPDAARSLPRIGDAFRLDYEAIAELSPDLILAWRSGNPRGTQDRLRELDYRLVAMEPTRLEDVAAHIREIGALAGTSDVANTAADAYVAGLADLRQQYETVSLVRVFYQVSAQPLLTVSRRHVIGQALELCGGENVFADLTELTPVIGVESVLDAGPEVIIASRSGTMDGQAEPLSVWKSWPSVPAVAADNLYIANADLLSRASVRLLDGIRQVCDLLDLARAKSAVNPAADARVFPDVPHRDSVLLPARTAGLTAGSGI